MSATSSRDAGVSAAGLTGVAFSTGAAVMVVELMAVRLMAPWFGQSQIVWTNVIGVVLLALALGQWVGGRWAEGWALGKSGASPGFANPAVLLVASGAFAIALPSLVPVLAGAVLPDDVRLTEAYPFVSLGSLLVSVVAVGVPLFALGAVTPWLVRLSRGVTSQPGRVTGRLLAAGTLGSLLGTFGATHVLLATVGAAGAVRGAGVVLVVIGVLLARSLGKRLRGAWVLVVAGLVAAAVGDAKPRTSGETILASVETPYQFAYVDEDDQGVRALRINEALDSFHSLYKPGEVLTGRYVPGSYYDAFLAPALAAPPVDDAGTRRVLVVGLGGGTMARQLVALDPSLDVVGIEIDAELVRLGREYMGLPENVRVAAGVDGRFGLAATEGRFSAILVDAYAQQIYLPHHLCTREFFALVSERLVDGGVAALNLGGLTLDDPVVRAVASTFATELSSVVAARIPGSRNLICIGFRGHDASRDGWGDVLDAHGLREDLDWMTRDAAFSPVRPQAPVLRDGFAPVEALAHDSWKGGSVTPRRASFALLIALATPAVDGAVAAQLEQARLAIQRGDIAQAERTLESIDRADATERELALLEFYEGNADFNRLEYEEAGVHYDAARIGFAELDERAPGSERRVLEAIDENIAQVNAELARSARIERDVGRVVTWLVVAAALAAAAVAMLVRGSRLG